MGTARPGVRVHHEHPWGRASPQHPPNGRHHRWFRGVAGRAVLDQRDGRPTHRRGWLPARRGHHHGRRHLLRQTRQRGRRCEPVRNDLLQRGVLRVLRGRSPPAAQPVHLPLPRRPGSNAGVSAPGCRLPQRHGRPGDHPQHVHGSHHHREVLRQQRWPGVHVGEGWTVLLHKPQNRLRGEPGGRARDRGVDRQRITRFQRDGDQGDDHAGRPRDPRAIHPPLPRVAPQIREAPVRSL